MKRGSVELDNFLVRRVWVMDGSGKQAMEEVEVLKEEEEGRKGKEQNRHGRTRREGKC